MDVKYSIVGALTLLAVSQIVFAAEPKPAAMISIVGEGTTRAIPDGAVLLAGVATNATTAHEAISLNGEAVASVLKAAKSGGLVETDIQTADLSLQPRYAQETISNGVAKIVGYQVINRLSLRVRNLDHLGDITDALVSAGANQLYGLTFEVIEMQKYADSARKAAVADARRKAELYARAVGVKLGRLVSLSDGPSELAAPRPLMRAASASSVPVESGEIDLRAQVNAAWELLQN